VQNEIAAGVATSIGLELTPEEQRRWSTRRPIDPQTYETYLRGMHLINRGLGTREERLEGIRILHEAIERDPANAHAYAGLALGYVTLGHGPDSSPDAWSSARAAALRAVTLDPELAEAHSALAEVRMYSEWDWAGAEQAFRRANELNPNLAMNHYHYAWYHALFGRMDEALEEHRRAQALDPLTPVHTAYLGLLYSFEGRHQEALAETRKAMAFAPNAPPSLLAHGTALFAQGAREEGIATLERLAGIAPPFKSVLGEAYAAVGRIDEAREIARWYESQPPSGWSDWSLSQLYAQIGSLDDAFRRMSYRPAHPFLPWVRMMPAAAPLWKDPRFAALMAEMKLPGP
jgi:tetratricopeptide (TPR) repeat protein